MIRRLLEQVGIPHATFYRCWRSKSDRRPEARTAEFQVRSHSAQLFAQFGVGVFWRGKSKVFNNRLRSSKSPLRQVHQRPAVLS